MDYKLQIIDNPDVVMVLSILAELVEDELFSTYDLKSATCPLYLFNNLCFATLSSRVLATTQDATAFEFAALVYLVGL